MAQRRVLTAILHTEVTSVAWALGLRNLGIPGPILPLTGMPFDMARNVAVHNLLSSGIEWCLRPECIVETGEGGKKIKDVQVGDLVRTHLGRLRPVTQVFRRGLKQRSPLLLVRTANSGIKCTLEHPFFVSRGRGVGCFIRAEDLQVGDEVLYPDRFKEDWLEFGIRFNTVGVNGDGKLGSVKNGQVLGKLPVTEDVARFLGLYLAEGCPTHDGLCFTFNNEEQDYINFVGFMSKLLFGRRPSVTKRHAANVKINVRPLGKLFGSWFGWGARKKRVPEFVNRWSLRNRLWFLLGYLQGDGHLTARTEVWSYQTSSGELAEGIRRLAGSCGMVSKCCRVRGQIAILAGGQEIKSGPAVHGWFAKKSCEKAKDLLVAIRDGDFLRIPIVAIERKQMSANLMDQAVYNLEVEEDHSYIADCSSVHNCFFLDSDVVPPHDAVYRLLAHNKPLISGVYHRRSPPHGLPVMIRGGTWVQQYPPNAVIEVDYVGAGCLLTHRTLYERLPALDERRGKRWFDWRVDMPNLPPGEALSEDFAMCLEVRRKLGIPILVDTSVQCRHIGLAQATFGKMEPCDVMAQT